MPDIVPPPAVAMRGLRKTFGPVIALDDAELVVARGTIHGLVGQNGAGKSTIIKVLGGLYPPDAGSISIGGVEQRHLTPRLVEQLGVHIIHQDRLLVPTFTVGEALFMGHEIGRGPLGLLDRRAMQRRAAEVLRRYFEVELPAGALVADLTTAQQKIVQITRALLNGPSVLVLDEPTAALIRREVDSLFATLRRLRDEGIAIIYISHYMQEIEQICDAVTVLRNGATVGTVDPAVTPTAEIVSMMIARDISEMFPKRATTPGETVLEARRLSRAGSFRDVSFALRRGEILGVTGLLGSGAKELVQCLYGLRPASSGELRVEGRPVVLRAPSDAVRHGIAMVPEDRRSHGVALGLSVRENVTLASLDRYGAAGFIRRASERAGVDRLIQGIAIKAPSRETAVRKLSGGNQQKVVLAKWLSRKSSIYLLDEPTVAVDVGAKAEIYRLLARLAAEGAGILLLSTDLLELTGLCDRILVLYRGELVAAFEAAATGSDELLRWATGAERTSA